jgi:hypothetical protein
MADIHAGIVRLPWADLARYLRLQDKERVARVYTNRRGNPPFLVFDTNLGKARHEMRYIALSQAMHLPPMHQVVDVWFEGPEASLLITGAKLPLVRHGKMVGDVPFSVETVEEKPGRPAYQAGKFAA